jgi:gliding motility-associated-like protein
MTRILTLMLCLLIYGTNASAQTYYAVTALTGTQTVGGNTVTITSSGNVATTTYCGAGPYWVGGPNNGTGNYTYAFATPVSSIRVQLTAMNDGEIISFSINGSPYTLTAANITAYAGTCGQAAAALSGGNLVGPPSTPSTPGVGAEVNINIGSGINTATVSANGVQAGTTYNFLFSSEAMADATNNGPVCWGSTLKLFGASTTAGATYSWTGPAGFTSGLQNPIIPNATAANAGSYVLTVTSGAFTSTDTTIVTMLPTPNTPVLTFDNPACLGGNINLHATTTPAGATFEWWGPNSFTSTAADPTIAVAADIHTGIYKAVADINGCKSDTGSVLVTVKHPVYDTFTTQICDGEAYIFNGAPITLPGMYSAVLTGANGCDSFSTVILQVKPLPYVAIVNSCKNDDNGKAYAATFAGDTVTYQYVWKNSQNDTLSLTDTLTDVPSGTYTLRITTFTCDTTLTFFLPDEEHHVSFLTDTIICMGTVATFQNTSDNHFTQFRWNFGDQDSSQLQHPTHPYPEAGSYRVTLIGKGAICTDTTYGTIIVDAVPEGVFRTTPDSICTGNSIGFLLPADSSIVSLNWQFGDGNGLTGPNEREVRHAYDSSGALPVTLITYSRACPEVTYTDTVYVYGLPKINLGPDTVLCLRDAPILLSNLEPSPAVPFHSRWSTGDTTQVLKVVHPGIYSLTLTNEPLGCSSTESVTINKDCYIDIPNAFTPNGDGVNDYFFPRQLLSRNVTGFHMQIFNRWGQIVFETKNKDGRGWDGRFNGTMQQTGVFIYMIDVTLDNRAAEHYTGNVSLLQ